MSQALGLLGGGLLSPDLIIPALTGIAILCAALFVAWPYVSPDRRAERMERIKKEREAIRVRERARMQPVATTRLTDSPRKFFSEIVRRVGGDRRADGGRMQETSKMLRLAGFRGERPVIAYLALQVLLPIAFCGPAAFWIFVMLQEPPQLAAQLAILVGAAAVGYFLPLIYVKNIITKRRKAILKAWPDALDLLLICVESGMTIEVALSKIAEEIAAQSSELADELNLTVAELSYLQDRVQAMRNLGERSALFSVRAVVSSLIQSEKYGTSLANSLRVAAAEQREARLIEAEKKAAALPPKLTVPMILFFLPVLFVVILAPAIIKVASMDTPF